MGLILALTFEIINEILEIDDSYKAPNRLMKILLDKAKREKVFCQFLEYEKDMCFDWFHQYFQEEHAQRKTKKQDFTPNSISEILSKIVQQESNHSTLDIAAGTGGLTITKWQEDRMKQLPWEYKPSNYFYQLEEMSDRAIPFLLFNLVIRGMNAVVVHGDSLHREIQQIYFVQNDAADCMTFSSLNVMPRSEAVTKEFKVDKWLGEPITHVESPIPDFVKEMITRET